MDDREWLAQRFEEHRSHMRAVAYRILGSASEADDAVQEAWLRLSRTQSDDIQNLPGWLTTVVSRVCLDMLRSRTSRREQPLDDGPHEPWRAADDGDGTDPEQNALLADSVGVALLVVLDTLSPAERVAFVLHDMFAVPFDQIAPVIGRTPGATKMLASRARRRVQGAQASADADANRQRAIVDAFLAASRDGDFDALLELLDPEIVLKADEAAVQAAAARRAQGAPTLETEIHGVSAVAGIFTGRAQAAQLATIGGRPGAVWARGGHPHSAFTFTIEDGKIVAIELISDPDRIRELDIVVGA